MELTEVYHLWCLIGISTGNPMIQKDLPYLNYDYDDSLLKVCRNARPSVMRVHLSVTKDIR